MLQTIIKKHVPMPMETRAYFCGNCNAVSLDRNNICNPKGMLQKIDWCGSKDLPPPKFCQNRVNNDRYSCKQCGKASINAVLLCDPEKMDMPK